MTTDEALGGIQRRLRERRERKSIPPFGDGTSPNATSNILDRLLARCRFAPFRDMRVSDQGTYFLSHDEARRLIEPQFEMVVDDLDQLTSRLDVHEDDLEMGLSARSPRLRRYEVLERWSMDTVPPDLWLLDPAKLEGLQSGRGIDFVLAMRIVTGRQELVRQGLGPGKVLCRKVFSVKESTDTLTFPFRWVNFGSNTDYPDEALWAIEWNHTEDEAQFEPTFPRSAAWVRRNPVRALPI